MPLYSFKCSNGHKETRFSKINDRDAVHQCDSCGANLMRLLEAPSVQPDIPAYQSPVTGQWIDSRSARREDLRRNNCIEWEPGIREDVGRIRSQAQEKSIAPLEAAIEKTARELSAAGKLDPL